MKSYWIPECALNQISEEAKGELLPTVLMYDDVFVEGPDGRRHPTRDNLLDAITILYARGANGPSIELLERLASVAPKEEL